MGNAEYMGVVMTNCDLKMTKPPEKGTWLYATTNDFAYAYLYPNWPAKFQEEITEAYKTLLTVFDSIKAAVKTATGNEVSYSFYLGSSADIVGAIDSIPGLAQSSDKPVTVSGTGSAVAITVDFMSKQLVPLAPATDPPSSYIFNRYLATMMQFQEQLEASADGQEFGTLIGFVSGIPALNVITYTFKYIYAQPTENPLSLDCPAQAKSCPSTS